jgi:hypothetical protein
LRLVLVLLRQVRLQAVDQAEDVSSMSLFNLFNRSRLTAAEKQLLAAVSAELTPTAGRLFNEQLDQVNLVQRQADGKEVNLYVMRRGKPFIEDRFLFPLRSEAQLAIVEMDAGDGQKAFRAEVWLVNGHVFSIGFNKPPQKFLEQGANVTKVEILRDPMVPASDEDVVDAKRHEEVLKAIQSKVPEEYLRWVGEGKGFSFHEWTVYGLPKIRKIPQRDGNYYLLAEREGMGAVGIKEDETSGQLYYLDYGDDRGERISVGLKLFLEKFDGGKVTGRF